MCPNSPLIFRFDLNEFSMEKIFNIQLLLHDCLKHYENSSAQLDNMGIPMVPKT
jgi:hypothetical protein